MINDPNYNLPKDAFIRLFDNPIPAGDPARSEAPEWAQELDEVVVWAHMGDDGQVSVKVNGEDIGGGDSGFQTATVNFTDGYIPVPILQDGTVFIPFSQTGEIENVIVPLLLASVNEIDSITGSYETVTVDGEDWYVITGNCTVDIGGLG